MSNELIPCPFCGESDLNDGKHFSLKNKYQPSMWNFRHWCEDKARLIEITLSSRQSCIEVWNARADETESLRAQLSERKSVQAKHNTLFIRNGAAASEISLLLQSGKVTDTAVIAKLEKIHAELKTELPQADLRTAEISVHPIDRRFERVVNLFAGIEIEDGQVITQERDAAILGALEELNNDQIRMSVELSEAREMVARYEALESAMYGKIWLKPTGCLELCDDGKWRNHTGKSRFGNEPWKYHQEGHATALAAFQALTEQEEKVGG